MRLSSGERFRTQDFVQQSRRCLLRTPCCRIAARQREGAKVSDPLERVTVGPKEFAAPNRAIRAPSRPVPGDAQRGGVKVIFRHARQDVGPVMLNAAEWNV